MGNYELTHINGKKFVFHDGMIKSCDSNISMNEPDEVIMPSAGPMQNQMYDYNGTTKVITVTGELFDTNISVIQDSSGTPTDDITTIKAMKYWLESFLNGSQTAVIWKSPYDEYSLSSSGGSTVIDGKTIPGTWVATKVYVISVEFPDEEDLVGNLLPFTLTMKVAGD